MKWVIRFALAVAGVAALFFASVAIFVATFDINRYKPLAIDWVKTHKNRTLAIDGPIAFSAFPRVELRLAKLRLSEPGRADSFLEADSAALAVDLLPLLARRLQVGKVSAEGVRLVYQRDARGKSNIDDLFGSGAADPAGGGTASAPPLAFDVSSIRLAKLSARISDEQNRLHGAVELERLETGRLSDRVDTPVELDARFAFKQPALNGQLSGKAVLRVEVDAAQPARSRASLSDMALVFKGDALNLRAADLQLAGALALDPASGALRAERLRVKLASKIGALEVGESLLTLDGALYEPASRKIELTQLAARASLRQNGRVIDAELAWPRLQAAGEQLEGSAVSGKLALKGDSPLALAFSSAAPAGGFDAIRLPQLKIMIDGGERVAGQVQTDLTLRPGAAQASLEALVIDLKLASPSVAPQALRLSGRASASATDASWQLSGSLGNGPFASAGSARLGNGPPVFNAQLQAAALDLDSLLLPAPKAVAAESSPGADTPVDLAAAAGFRGTLEAQVGSLTAQRIQFSDVRLSLQGDGITLGVPAFQTRVWGGSLQGRASVVPATQQIVLAASADGVRIEQVLKDLSGRDSVEGNGRLTMNVQASGKTVQQLKLSLAGQARVLLRDGAVKGINLARTLRQAKAALTLQKDEIQKARTEEKTDFSEISASFDITQGVARSDDLQGKSPLLRVAGGGDIDIARGSINYTVRATVADTLQGQDAVDLASLRGVQVPVLLSGPLDAMQYQVQWSVVSLAVLQEALKTQGGAQLKGRLGEPLRNILNLPAPAEQKNAAPQLRAVPGELRPIQGTVSTPATGTAAAGAPASAAARASAPASAPREALRDKLRGLLKP